SFTSKLGSTMTADYVITAQGDVAFSNQFADQPAALPEFAEVSAVRWGNMRIDGDQKGVAAGDLTRITDLLKIGADAGDPVASARPGTIVISQSAADEHAVGVGDSLDVEFAASGAQRLTVGAVYDNTFLIGDYVLDLSSWGSYFDSADDNVISARVADGVEL